MKPIIHKRPDMTCETAALLYISNRRDELVELMITLIGERDWDVREFMTRYGALHEKYISCFNRLREDNAYSPFLFGELGLPDYLILVIAFLLDRSLVFDAQSRSPSELRELLRGSFNYIKDSIPYSFSADSSFDESVSDDDALRKVYENPVEFFDALAELIRKNVPAAEDAWDSIRSDAQTFLSHNAHNADDFYKRTGLDKNADITDIYPLPSIYTNAFIVGNNYYYGLFNADMRPDKNLQNEFRTVSASCKALGDHTRMEMLRLLREKPRYNRELAKLCGISPATALHHIDLLLNCGIVKMTNQSADLRRIYYSLDEETVMQLLNALERLLIEK